MTSGAETNHAFTEKEREANKIRTLHTMNTEICILCVYVFLQEFKVDHCTNLKARHSRFLRTNGTDLEQKEILIARKFPLYHAV